MYNIIQLNDKDLSELQQIAKELGLKKTDSLRKKNWCTAFWTNKLLSVPPKKWPPNKTMKNAKKDNHASVRASA